MTREQKAKASDIRRRLRALRALIQFHREWNPESLFLERRGVVHGGGVAVYVNEASGEVGGEG
jgi:hypothetical protein